MCDYILIKCQRLNNETRETQGIRKESFRMYLQTAGRAVMK